MNKSTHAHACRSVCNRIKKQKHAQQYASVSISGSVYAYFLY